MAIRVMHFCPFMYYGGTERHLYNLLSRLPSEFESIVCAPTGPMTPMIESVADRLDASGTQVKNLRIGQAVRCSMTSKNVSNLRPDLVHIYFRNSLCHSGSQEIGMNCR